MKVLVTGAKGFIGKNLCLGLKHRGIEVFEFDVNNDPSDLKTFVNNADFIVHLAGINRPLSKEEFVDGNVNTTVRVINLIKETGKKIPLVLSSSTQAIYDNDYGKSKKAAEDYVFNFQRLTDNPVYVFRFANVFGKWCRPNYNSMVATFCYNIANGLEISVNENAPVIDFIYIDDIVATICDIIEAKRIANSKAIQYITPSYKSTPKEIANILYRFKESRNTILLEDQSDGFVKKLYATYLSYLPTDQFDYALNMHVDDRGSFTEVLKTLNFGQVSINVGKPGIIKGNHYHNTKNEKFLVVHGTCEIKFRKIGTDEVYTYIESGDKLRVVDIPTGYTHSIKNIGKDDSVTLMWANEQFDKDNSDTYFEEVEKNGK